VRSWRSASPSSPAHERYGWRRGLVVHAALILTALTGVGVPRYVLGLWVPMAIGTGLTGLWILKLCALYRLLRRHNINK
jgi:hypothetical protein